jgi:hypothetical protein
MRRYVWLLLGMGMLGAVSAAGIAAAAGAEGPVTVRVGSLELTSDVGFRPTVGSKTPSGRSPVAPARWASSAAANPAASATTTSSTSSRCSAASRSRDSGRSAGACQ